MRASLHNLTCRLMKRASFKKLTLLISYLSQNRITDRHQDCIHDRCAESMHYLYHIGTQSPLPFRLTVCEEYRVAFTCGLSEFVSKASLDQCLVQSSSVRSSSSSRPTRWLQLANTVSLQYTVFHLFEVWRPKPRHRIPAILSWKASHITADGIPNNYIRQASVCAAVDPQVEKS